LVDVQDAKLASRWTVVVGDKVELEWDAEVPLPSKDVVANIVLEFVANDPDWLGQLRVVDRQEDKKCCPGFLPINLRVE
jgi:hypothetical protein